MTVQLPRDPGVPDPSNNPEYGKADGSDAVRSGPAEMEESRERS